LKEQSLKTTTPFKSFSTWLRPVDVLILVYQVLLGVVVMLGNVPVNRSAWLLVHVIGSCLIIWFCHAMSGKTEGFWYFVREWYPLIVMTFLYKEVGPLVHALTPDSLDALLTKTDETVFGGGGPALWRWQEAHHPARWLNEYFHIGYSFYFLLMPMGGFVLWFRSSREHFRTYMFALSLTYYVHYLLFILCPAHSPRFFIQGLREPLPGYFVSNLLHRIVEGNAYPGGSFPSSHVAAALVVFFMTQKALGKWRIPVLLVTLTLFAGTVWGRYHYVSDLVAGFLMGLLLLKLSPILESWLNRCIERVDVSQAGGLRG
jgi:membrane-associated phospholipid phosphatase